MTEMPETDSCGDKPMHDDVDRRIEEQLIETTLFEDRDDAKHPICAGPNNPRYRPLVRRMEIHLAQERKERGEYADVPAGKNYDGRYILPTLVDNPFREQYPDTRVCDGKKY